MGTAVAIRFPLGRYHATPWDRSVNEGAVEWPPSPWRILRALISVWHDRCPQLPAAEVEELLHVLGELPSFKVPSTTLAHTRHYLPDAEHRRGETGRTDLTLDPFVALSCSDELVVYWDAELNAGQRALLRKLLHLLPYLGRAESLCEARLVIDFEAPDHTWWRPANETNSADGHEMVRRLAPLRPISRKVLETSPHDVRRAHRTVPEGSAWVEYVVPEQEPNHSAVVNPAPSVTAVLLSLRSTAPFLEEYGVLAADVLRKSALERFDGWQMPSISGKSPSGDRLEGQHSHVHWLPLAGEDRALSSMLVWVRDGLSTEAVARLLSIRELRLPRGRSARGFRPARLALAAAGTVEQVAPQLVGPAKSWISRTPYLPVRHRKRQSVGVFVNDDIQHELTYRSVGQLAAVELVNPAVGDTDHFARPWRRYRLDENMGQRRPGVAVRLRFHEPVRGPLSLGALSHFGFGLFVPIPE